MPHGKISYLATLVTACTLSMVISYGLIRAMTHGKSPRPSPDVAAQKEAGRLRDLCDSVAGLGSDFVERVTSQRPELRTGLSRWLSGEFNARLQTLRRRVLDMTGPEAPRAALLHALDQLATAAVAPDQAEVRLAATEAILEAVTEVEAYLSETESR